MTDVPTWKKKILLIELPSMVEAENFSDHPCIPCCYHQALRSVILCI